MTSLGWSGRWSSNWSGARGRDRIDLGILNLRHTCVITWTGQGSYKTIRKSGSRFLFLLKILSAVNIEEVNIEICDWS